MLVMLDGKTCSMMIVWHRLCDDKNDHQLIGTTLNTLTSEEKLIHSCSFIFCIKGKSIFSQNKISVQSTPINYDELLFPFVCRRTVVTRRLLEP